MHVSLIRIVITDKNTVKWYIFIITSVEAWNVIGSDVFTFQMYGDLRRLYLSMHRKKQCALVPQNPDKVIKMQTANIDYLKNYQHMNII